ncbi:hypothetical protein DTB58_38320 [Streptomyces griseus]|nr:hypothetical protein [Streptomyces griseus]
MTSGQRHGSLCACSDRGQVLQRQGARPAATPAGALRHAAGASGLREMTARDRLDAELGVLKIDVSREVFFALSVSHETSD